jgi:hypothetical protein
MNNNINNRERKVDIDALPIESIEQISAKLGEKLGAILQRAAEEANKFLNIYGLTVKVSYQVESLSKEPKLKE